MIVVLAALGFTLVLFALSMIGELLEERNNGVLCHDAHVGPCATAPGDECECWGIR